MGLEGSAAVAQFNDGVTQCFGTGDTLCTVWDVTDPDANLWMIEVPTGGVVDVPVVVVGQGIIGVDLALFDGLVQPGLAVMDSDRDSAIRLGFVADDRPAILMHGAAGFLELPNTLITEGNGLVIGHSAQITSTAVMETQILGTATPDSGFLTARFSADNSGPVNQFLKSRDPAIADGTFAIVENGDLIGAFVYLADDGTDFASQVAQIRVEIDGVPGENDTPGRLVIRTTPSGSAIPVERVRISASGQLLVGDTENANNLAGLTVNMGAADGEIIGLKSSDVAHGLTSLTETDTFGRIGKAGSTTGGLAITGVSFDASNIGINLDARYETGNTTKGLTANAPITLVIAKHDGSNNSSAPSADENMVVVKNVLGGGAKWLIDEDGDVHYDGTTNATAWDDYDDIALLTAARGVLMPVRSEMRERFAEFIDQYKEVLHATGVLTINDDGHHFVSTKGMNGLIIDALRQVDGRVVALEQEHKGLRGSKKWSMKGIKAKILRR